MNPNRLRFLEAAAAGAHPGASSGEKIANRLAKVLSEIGDDLALVDSEIIDGACLALRTMGGPWPTDEFKRQVFKPLKNAAEGRKP